MKYKILFILTYVLFTVSFLIPAFNSNAAPLGSGRADVWYGWACALFVFKGVLATFNLLAILLALPNLFMVIMPFVYRHIGPIFILLVLLFNVGSCSYWWVTAVTDGNIASLLPGYWLWFGSILGSNIILLLNKRVSN